MRRPSRFESACLGVVALAFLVRVDMALHPDVIWDSAWYLQLARSFGSTGTFLMPWTDPPQYNGYWPPLFPIFLAPLVKLFGATYPIGVVGASLATALLTLATFLCTRDLFDRTRGFAAAALVAANPAFLVSDSRGMSESILALAVMLTVWAFLKGLKDGRWMIAAGAFGALAYLGKPNLGLPFVAAGLVAVAAWRISQKGVRKADVAVGAVALLALVALAFTRGPRLGGVGLSLIEPVARAWLHPEMIGPVPFYVLVFPFKLVFALGFLAAVTLPFSLHAGAAARRWREERMGALWLAALIPLVAGVVFTTSFYMTEHRSLVDFDNIRYLTPAIVPAIWLVIGFWPVEEDPAAESGLAARRRHEVPLLIAAALYVALLFLSPIAGKATLSRLQLLLILALAPLLLALMASRARYATATRRAAGGATETRYVEAPAPPVGSATKRAAWAVLGATLLFLVAIAVVHSPDLPPDGGVLFLFFTMGGLLALALFARPAAWPAAVALGVVVAAFAYWISAWYLAVALGLAIAACAASRRIAVLVMALVLLAATAPGYTTAVPYPTLQADLHKLLPPGTVVGVDGPIVYVAAVAPADLTLRESGLEPAPGVDALLVTPYHGEAAPPNFTRVASWDYAFSFSATLQARLWIEEHVFSQDVEVQTGPGAALFERTNSSLYQRDPSS
ncbi:MAG: hypothetical protein QOE90_1098 [Thermoplasmata archaeon]|jgi:hypothetical protein|nr:hypothetical protein [Thermoplasmata archaeon]